MGAITMKNFELQATFENVLDTFEKDMWGRNADVRAFVELKMQLMKAALLPWMPDGGPVKHFL